MLAYKVSEFFDNHVHVNAAEKFVIAILDSRGDTIFLDDFRDMHNK